MIRTLCALTALLLAVCGPAAAQPPPHAYEFSGPRHAEGAVLVIHGGGWRGGQRRFLVEAQPYAAVFARRFRTLSIDYRSGQQALADVRSFFDYLRESKGDDYPICVHGYSAGGHLALLLAAERDVACVIVEAAPTDLTSLNPYLLPFAQQSFGASFEQLRSWSAIGPGATRAPTLLLYARNDPLVGLDQARAWRRLRPQSRLIVLDAGQQPYVHSTVDANVLRAARAQARRFVAASMRAWREG